MGRALGARAPVVLAVSGGRDSMALMEAAARAAPGAVAAVATFDHGTGPAARRAAAHVRRRARALGFAVAGGRAAPGLRGEAAWRSARWDFLRRVAERYSASVATAHTLDDQVETVFIRILRGAGARGLAGMWAEGDVVRPLLGLRRSAVARYAQEMGVEFVEDPSNASRAHLRNRVRLDLLPAIRRLRPNFERDLLDLARRAAEWRREMDALAERIGATMDAHGTLHVAEGAVRGYDPEALRVLWPAVAARAGLTLDRRGTYRLAEFTISGRSGSRVQLSGGLEVVRHRSELMLRRTLAEPPSETGTAVTLAGAMQLGRWILRPMEEPDRQSGANGMWIARLPTDVPLAVRVWSPGDRMRAQGRRAARRVKRYFAEAGIPAVDRASWPVVLAGDEILWVPGVCRGDAAAERSGRPGSWYLCERTNQRNGERDGGHHGRLPRAARR
ncbi:MAG TPA: tRNA lysidine(34) synthetase TilS [Gemmatimonadaceae bacterium]|nr:tRNA lysidine(34) synthetase TilS [Gemmatimonadaceae bacterium]